MPQQPYVDMTLLVVLFLSAAFDLAQRRIPNRLLAAALIAAFLLHVVWLPPIALLTNLLAGAAVGLIMFLPLYIARAMAAGDVKLMATVGAFTGPVLCFESGLAAYCAGGLLALVMVLAKGRAGVAAANVVAILRPMLIRLVSGIPLEREPMPHPSVGSMPYAVAIMAGTVLMLWIRHG